VELFSEYSVAEFNAEPFGVKFWSGKRGVLK
jgi:hypothetical protein